jgi:hypothetical protein
MLFTGLLKRGLPILAGLGVADVWEKLFKGRSLPGNIPSPEPVYKNDSNRFQKMVILAGIAAIVLTLGTYVLRRMKIKLPF